MKFNFIIVLILFDSMITGAFSYGPFDSEKPVVKNPEGIRELDVTVRKWFKYGLDLLIILCIVVVVTTCYFLKSFAKHKVAPIQMPLIPMQEYDEEQRVGSTDPIVA